MPCRSCFGYRSNRQAADGLPGWHTHIGSSREAVRAFSLAWGLRALAPWVVVGAWRLAMEYLFPLEGEPIDPSWWAPLKAVGRAVAATPRYRFFEVDDFMLMGGVDRRPRTVCSCTSTGTRGDTSTSTALATPTGTSRRCHSSRRTPAGTLRTATFGWLWTSCSCGSCRG